MGTWNLNVLVCGARILIKAKQFNNYTIPNEMATALLYCNQLFFYLVILG